MLGRKGNFSLIFTEGQMMEEANKAVLIFSFMFFLLIAICVAINVGTEYSCKTSAIAAGMKAQEVQEACK